MPAEKRLSRLLELTGSSSLEEVAEILNVEISDLELLIKKEMVTNELGLALAEKMLLVDYLKFGLRQKDNTIEPWLFYSPLLSLRSIADTLEPLFKRVFPNEFRALLKAIAQLEMLTYSGKIKPKDVSDLARPSAFKAPNPKTLVGMVRAKFGFSTGQLGKILRVKEHKVVSWESGSRKMPNEVCIQLNQLLETELLMEPVGKGPAAVLLLQQAGNTWLRAYRLYKQISQTDFANRLGISQPVISIWERDSQKIPESHWPKIIEILEADREHIPEEFRRLLPED